MKMPSIFPVASHTDNVGPGSTFVAIRGLNFDGHHYIDVAIEKGATTIVVENDYNVKSRSFDTNIRKLVFTQDDSILSMLDVIQSKVFSNPSNSDNVVLSEVFSSPSHPEWRKRSERCIEGSKDSEISIQFIKTNNTRKVLAQRSAQAAGHPAKKLKLFGVTGTKGKTTSVYLMHHLLNKAGYKTALLSTIKNCILDQDIPATMTTAQPDYLHQFFKLCVEAGVEYVIMELAAQATTFDRLEMLEFDGLIFTNLDREHAELYPTMRQYFEAKAKIFEYAKPNCIMVSNTDDEYGKKLADRYPHSVPLSIQNWQEGKVCIDKQIFTYSNLPGLFNAYNLSGVLLLFKNLGLHIDVNIGALPAIPGRLQEVKLPNGARAYIDYAHTPGSFKSLFFTVRAWTDNLIVIFGAGGGKDPQKRALMGSAAEQFADKIILTDDNPRQENPQQIVNDILAGIVKTSKVIVEHDRQKAIERAYEVSQEGSIMLILGKGPDEHQIIGTKKIPFSEKGILESL